jgi:hypothetical protein
LFELAIDFIFIFIFCMLIWGFGSKISHLGGAGAGAVWNFKFGWFFRLAG